MAQTSNVRRYYRLAKREGGDGVALSRLYWEVMSPVERDTIDTHFNRTQELPL